MMSHGPYSRRSRSDDVEPVSSYAAMRQAIAQQVRLTVRPEDTLGDVHARFTARLRCPVCFALGPCTDRNREADLKLIFGELA